VYHISHISSTYICHQAFCEAVIVFQVAHWSNEYPNFDELYSHTAINHFLSLHNELAHDRLCDVEVVQDMLVPSADGVHIPTLVIVCHCTNIFQLLQLHQHTLLGQLVEYCVGDVAAQLELIVAFTYLLS
jgi:hypothetical protein